MISGMRVTSIGIGGDLNLLVQERKLPFMDSALMDQVPLTCSITEILVNCQLGEGYWDMHDHAISLTIADWKRSHLSLFKKKNVLD